MNFRNKVATLALGLLASTSALQAQIGDLRYRVEAGITESMISNFGIGKPLTGYRVGAYVVIPFEYTSFSFNTGLLLTNKGEKSNFYVNGPSGQTSKTDKPTSLRLTYLQLPIEASFRINFSKDFKSYINFGPYFAYGVAGNAKDSKTGTVKKLLSGENKNFKNFEWGLNFNLAFAYKDIYVKGAVEYGMNDAISSVAGLEGAKTGTARNAVFAATIGYQF